jgi:hypothetical protein
MAGFSTSLANAILNTTLRGQAFPTIRTTYFAMFTADPTDAFSAGTEVSAPWYARRPAGAFSAPNAGVSYNTTQVVFAPVSGSAVTITHVGVVEGSSPSDPTATLLYSYQLTEPKTLNVNDVYVVDTQGSSGDFTQQLL